MYLSCEALLFRMSRGCNVKDSDSAILDSVRSVSSRKVNPSLDVYSGGDRSGVVPGISGAIFDENANVSCSLNWFCNCFKVQENPA